jgi:hypothetical protein
MESLLESGEDGLSGDELVKRTYGGAVNTLKTMAKDPDWASIIILPGAPGRRYRLRLTDTDD